MQNKFPSKKEECCAMDMVRLNRMYCEKKKDKVRHSLKPRLLITVIEKSYQALSYPIKRVSGNN